MTLKEKLLQELETIEEADLQKVLEFVRSLNVSKEESLQSQPSTAWEAYTASKQERKRVYHRLAES